MEEKLFFIQHVSLQNEFLGSKGRGITHRINEKNCNTDKDDALGKKYVHGWNGIQELEKELKEKKITISRCKHCFPGSMSNSVPEGMEAFKEPEFREFMEEKLKFMSGYFEHSHGSPDNWKTVPEEKFEETFRSAFQDVKNKIDLEYNFDKLTDKHRWDLLRVTRDQLIKFLASYKNIDEKTYELLRRLIQKNLVKTQYVRKMLKENEAFNKEWLENSFPTYNNEVCSKLNNLISGIYASFGIIACNGRNHPFFCFCGFGGTRKSESSDK